MTKAHILWMNRNIIKINRILNYYFLLNNHAITLRNKNFKISTIQNKGFQIISRTKNWMKFSYLRRVKRLCNIHKFYIAAIVNLPNQSRNSRFIRLPIFVDSRIKNITITNVKNISRRRYAARKTPKSLELKEQKKRNKIIF